MQTFSMTYGNQTFKGSSGKVNIFAMKGDGTNHKDFPDRKFKKGSSQRVAASTSGTEIHGMFYPTSYEGEEGSVVMIQASTTRGGKAWADARMFVCLRDTASLIAIDVNLPSHSDAALDDIRAFAGRGDIIGKKELKKHGIELYSNELSNYFDKEEIEELFTVTTLLKGSAKPKMVPVATKDGETKMIQEPRQASRKLRIRR